MSARLDQCSSALKCIVGVQFDTRQKMGIAGELRVYTKFNLSTQPLISADIHDWYADAGVSEPYPGPPAPCSCLSMALDS